jgi:hypothetical protein
MKYLMMFEDYNKSDFDNYGKLLVELTPEDSDMVDKLKSIFGEEDYKGAFSTGDSKTISFEFVFRKGRNVILNVFPISEGSPKLMLSVEYPTSANENFEKEFNSLKEMMDFIKESPLKAFMK